MAKSELKAVAVNVGNPKDLPVGTLKMYLFGMTLDELAAEIALNKGGKWNDVYT